MGVQMSGLDVKVGALDDKVGALELQSRRFRRQDGQAR